MKAARDLTIIIKFTYLAPVVANRDILTDQRFLLFLLSKGGLRIPLVLGRNLAQ